MTYVTFTEIYDSGKTKVWEIRNSNDGSYLGVIKWHGAWRKYVMDSSFYTKFRSMPVPSENEYGDKYALPTIWSEDCLRDVAGFIKDQMDQRKVRTSTKLGWNNG